MRKRLLILLTVISVVFSFSVPVVATNTNNYEGKIALLVENGYTNETAEALSETEINSVYEAIREGRLIGIDTCSAEVDNLKEIDELINNDECANTSSKEAVKEVQYMMNCSDQELKERFNMSTVEIKALRSIADNQNMPKDSKKIKNEIAASGTIGAGRLTYTQTVTKKSKQYNVVLSYDWKGNYIIASEDRIAVAWGGKFNSKDEMGMTHYYRYKGSNGELGWKNEAVAYLMQGEAKPNKGYIFSFDTYKYFKGNAKAKKGSAWLTLYRNKYVGNDTKVISRYCHKTLKLGEITISASPSISVNEGYDVSQQQSTNITY